MTTKASQSVVDAVVVGAGFAGLYAVHQLNEKGFRVRAFEAGGDVGGTWYWNRYPGARCDVESVNYSYSFDEELVLEWDWSERFAAQPEILDYAAWVADRLNIRRFFTFGTRVEQAVFDEADSTWTVRTSTGESVQARFLITAVGSLSASSVPPFDGLESFAGRVLHTGTWPHEPVDLTGKRVAVIGTGSSGIQAIPELAKQAKHLTVFQRTPNFSLPARNRPLYDDERIDARKNYADLREKSFHTPGAMPLPIGHQRITEISAQRRQEMLEEEWKKGGTFLLITFHDTSVDLDANEFVAEFVRGKIRGIVDDQGTAEKLLPRGFPIGAKRIALDTNYYATFNRSNVDLVDVRAEPILRVTNHGIATTNREYAFDVVVLGTGFDAMTGPLTRIDIRGRNGISLAKAWEDGPKNYLGLSVAGFPNLFTITGPGSPSVLINVIRSIEQHVDWITDCLVTLRERGVEEIEADSAAQEAWVQTVNDIADQTFYVRTNSWYLGSNIPGKPRVFLPYAGGMLSYRTKCDQVAADDFDGFRLRSTVSS